MLKSFGLTGRNDYKVDSKGRINLPARMRKILAPNTYDEVVISMSSKGHLSVFNKDYWVSTIQQNIINRVDTVENIENWDAIQRAIHRLSENSHMSTVDSQGRINVPGWLLEKAGITKEVVVVGAVDRVSIWAPDRYAKWLDKEGDDSSLTGIYI
ncbi:division/cell wall cluster transcriptional repressor MraZ [Candidatus Latescibacterota bacterium]